MVRKDAVAIVIQESVWIFIPDRLPQLLQRPSRIRMGCDVEMDQTTAAMLDHYEHIQLPTKRRRILAKPTDGFLRRGRRRGNHPPRQERDLRVQADNRP